ncbi:MAG: TIGR04211 family SH3 domain-containing protein [Deltaproteobacteria bacterium]|nr:TIGR04211 family SH3 domain-containing protein [Deltaproteobacteria bacterium]
MWVIIAALCGLMLFPAVGLGKSLYVKATSEALLRAGPSLSNKILVILKPGQEVALVKEEGDYYVVATPNGTQGYVLKYLMTDQSSKGARPQEPGPKTQQRSQELEQQTQQKIQELEQQTQQKIQELETRSQEQEKELIALREERGRLEDAKKQAEGVASQQAQLVSQLQTQQRTAQSQETIRWFLAGAGVLFAGMLLGRLWGAGTRRSGLSLNRFK